MPADPPDQHALWQALTAPTRLPGLNAAGEAMLRRLRGHPAAPIYRDVSGHRLGMALRWQARCREPWLLHAPAPGPHAPRWLWPWMFSLQRRVRHWPTMAELRRGWSGVRTTSRADLAARLADLVPLDRQDKRLLCFTTSGTTGHPIRVPSSPLAAAAYQALHERALRLHGVRMQARQGAVGVVLVGFQARCFTYVSVNPLRGQCGLAKINLNPTDWRHADDRSRYLDDIAPELMSGDPVSLSELARLPMRHQPKALMSTSMAMSHGLRQRLSERFNCPVLDLYSMNEAGPIGVWVDAAEGFVLLQPGLYVEILDEQGQAVPIDTLGAITLTGGINACLPLLRYRTGDHARLVMTAFGPTLRDLQGRPPVCFRAHDGQTVNNVELTQGLRHLDLQRFALHQHTDGALTLRVASDAPDQAALHQALRDRIAAVLGPCPLHITPLLADDKVRQYTSDLETIA